MIFLQLKFNYNKNYSIINPCIKASLTTPPPQTVSLSEQFTYVM